MERTVREIWASKETEEKLEKQKNYGITKAQRRVPLKEKYRPL